MLAQKQDQCGSSLPPLEASEDQRRDPRVTTYNVVEIHSETGELMTGATIREISKRGAQLRLKSGITMPKRIWVRWPAGQLSTMATLRWAAGQDIGVEFDEEVRMPKQRPSAEQRIQMIASQFAGKPLRR